MSIKAIRFLALACITVEVLCLSLATADPRSQDAKKNAQMPKPIRDDHGRQVDLLCYSPKRKLIVSTPTGFNFAFDSTPALPVYVWDLSTGKLVHNLVGHAVDLTYIGVTSDGAKLLTAGDERVVLWDLASGSADQERFRGIRGGGRLTPSEKELFQVDLKGNVVIWDAKNVKQTRTLELPREATGGIKFADALRCAMSADGSLLAVGAGLGNRRIVLWNYDRGTVRGILSYEVALDNLSFSKSGRYLFAGGNVVGGRGVLVIWDTESLKVVQQVEMDEWRVKPVAYLPEEECLLSVDSLRAPELGDRMLFRTFINGYSIKTGERILSYDTHLPKDRWCTACMHMEDIEAICIGDARGTITFFSVAEVLKSRKQR